MTIQWSKFYTTVGLWLFCEVWLNFVGLDDLADYSEFLFTQDLELDRKNHQTIEVSHPHLVFCETVDYFCPIFEFKNRILDRQSTHQQLHQLRIVKTFEKKCRKLKHPCMRILSSHYSLDG